MVHITMHQPFERYDWGPRKI